MKAQDETLLNELHDRAGDAVFDHEYVDIRKDELLALLNMISGQRRNADEYNCPCWTKAHCHYHDKNSSDHAPCCLIAVENAQLERGRLTSCVSVLTRVVDVARRWCTRPESVLCEGSQVLANDADMWRKLRAAVAEVSKEERL